MMSIHENLQHVHRRIGQACAEVARPVQSVALLVVSKTFKATAVREAFAAGERRFAESYVQEGMEKIAALDDLRSQIEWHLIGPLQSNKTRVVAEQFDWVHSIDRIKIAQRLSEQRPYHLPPLQVCVQVNISGQSSKSGVEPQDAVALALTVAGLPRLRLRGLMAIPEAASDEAMQRAPHRALHGLLRVLHAQGLQLDTLSMGMSADLEAAIAEGATLVRVGSAIFGNRQSAVR